MSLGIETPYPIEGTVKYRSEDVTGWSLPCESEWISEHERGDIMEQIGDEMRTHHDPGVKAEFIVRENGNYEIIDVSELEDDD